MMFAMETMENRNAPAHAATAVNAEYNSPHQVATEHRAASRRAVLQKIIDARKPYYEPLKRRVEAGEALTEAEKRILKNCEDAIRELESLS